MEREPGTFSDDYEDGFSYVMLFQLLGIPNLNQRAREVPPFKSSLVSSGIFILISKFKLFFWIGSEYFSNYIDISNYDSHKHLVSEELLAKLVYIYEKSQNFSHVEEAKAEGDQKVDLSNKKMTFCIEGQENELWQEYIEGSTAKGLV